VQYLLVYDLYKFHVCSEEHDHKVDWVFVVDHGGFNRLDLHLQYSNYFIQQLASHLYISPTYSQVFMSLSLYVEQ